MEHPASVEQQATGVRVWAWIVALALVLGAIAARLSILFSKILPPGIDAAYYPMQARGILENGKLPYVEVPLIFWLDAALARVLMASRGMNTDDAVLLSSRIVDGVAQPFTAILLVLIVYAFAESMLAGMRSRGVATPAPTRLSLALVAAAMVACTTAVLSPPILRMTGDFQKNSLGFVWMAGSAWAAARAMSKGGLLRWAALALFLALASITHIGAFGVTLVLVGAAFAVYVVRRWKLRARSIIALGAGGVLAAGALWVLMYAVAPSKALGLVQGVQKMFTVGDRPQGAPSMGGADRPTFRENDRGPQFDRPMGPEGRPGEREAGRMNERSRPQGPPGGFPAGAMPMRIAAWAALILLGGWASWRARLLVPATQAIVSGAGIAAIFITCPLIQGQYAERLGLMTPIPLAIVASFVLLDWSLAARAVVRWSGLAVGAVVSCGLAFAAVPQVLRATGGPPRMDDRAFQQPGNFGPDRGRFMPDREDRGPGNRPNSELADRPGPDGRGGPGGQGGPGGPGGGGGGGGGAVVADEAVTEFRSLRGKVPMDGTAIVIARHGLQWWAGYFLKVPVREEHATQEQLAKYDRVYVLSEKKGGMDRGGPPGGGEDISRLARDGEIVHDGEFYRLVLITSKP